VIVDITGYAGVGKFTIGRIVAEQLGGRLLDNHTVYNVAFALTEFKSEAFHRTVRAVRDIAYQAVLDLPPSVPVVLTTTHGSAAWWSKEGCDAMAELARRRGSTLFVAHLLCDPQENRRRITAPERVGKRKPLDPAMVDGNADRHPQIDHADELLELDVTNVAAVEAARTIVTWVKSRETATLDPSLRSG
jgi:hypothetical protein